MAGRPPNQPPPDALIRINPARIHTQVTQAARYRPVRSVLLLALLIIVSVFVLFTLSQMAVVQHSMLAHLEAGRLGGGTTLSGTATAGRAARNHRRPWRSQFNQFKIEPLLVRNAPSVEVNTAIATNRRLANQVASIIVRNSLLVSSYHHHHHHNHSHHQHLHSPHHQSPSSPLSLTIQATTAPADTKKPPDTPGDLGKFTAVLASPTAQPTAPNTSLSTVEDGSGRPESRQSSASLPQDAHEPSDPSDAECDGCDGMTNATTSPAAFHNPQAEGVTSLLPTSHHHPDIPCTQRPSSPLTTTGEEVAGADGGNTTELPPPRPDAEGYEPIDEDVAGLASAPSPPPHSPPRLSEERLSNLSLCPEIPPGLLGHLPMDVEKLERTQLEDALKELHWVSAGGRWSPTQDPRDPCLPRHKVAVVLPYRDRLHHLIVLLTWLHPILRRQQLQYTIYVAEQAGNATFNKGSIMNAGFVEAWQRTDASCFVFHDVDLLPEDDRNMYSCPPMPRHLSVGVDTLGYKLPYFLLVGGVLSVRGEHFLRLNGYSNMYWGWGGEDDDMGYRIKQSGLSITRPPDNLARYTMIRHLKRRPLTWKVRGKLLRTSGRRYRLDGLNTLSYSLLAIHTHPLFTHLLLDVGNPPENLVKLDAPPKPSPTLTQPVPQ